MSTPNVSAAPQPRAVDVREARRRTLVSIVGAGRSGTTMLGAMLGRHRDAFFCGEVHAWFWPFRTHNRTIITESGQEIWEVIKRWPPQRFHLQTCEYLNVGCVVDSSKSLSWVVAANDWVRASGMEVVTLLLWKPPADLAYSHWKRGAAPDHWQKLFVGYYEKFLQLELPFASISYARLSERPKEYLEAICRTLGIGYEPGMERFWEAPASHVFGSLGTREQMRRGRPAASQAAGYADAFLPVKAQVERLVARDRRLQRILARLEAAELLSGTPPLDRPYRRRRPLWYYEQRARRKFRELFPHRSTTTQ